MTYEEEIAPDDAQQRTLPDSRKRRIVTHLHSANVNAEPLQDARTPSVRTSWAAFGWVDDALDPPARHSNRFVAPFRPDADAMDSQNLPEDRVGETARWNRIKKAVKVALERLTGRERHDH